MSLFQTSVVKKYLNDLSPELIDKKYKEFQDYFGSSEIQQNIRDSKEEEYQSGFVRALFVNILGYTLKPEPNYNFVLEKKNVDDSKKADGAILKDNEVIAVIELKSTQTTDLDTVETQAFGYKNHNPKCQYVITSNFEKIRLYIQNAIDHLEFDLFNLSREDFALLWLCFLKGSILQDVPLKIKESSLLQEENVTKKLYNDYSKFRTDIFENIVKNNPEFDKLILFKKTQKLLDRFLFIFFAEDRLLLPPNSISEIVKQWNDLKENYDEYFPLYERFKKYFGYLNTGFKGKKYDIFAYNGGLFLPDEILDNIKVDDEVLHYNTVQLSKYDFETDVDVNILGHIFEHSLSEIENVQAEIAGEEIDKQKTRRKKDGIFYTPKYITKYIVENTVGKLCEEKRNALGVIDEEYAKGRKNRKKDIVRALDEKLTQYRDWLLEITILDPACGSGAFLNQALEFLIQEHKKIDELKFQLLGGSIVFPDIEAKILENNIFGVDLNEESVEIAKLSLWLRTAQKGRKLTTLSNHIKCGNSLIDEREIAGGKAFNWQMEFPEIFAKGGFDIIIGNPPYGAKISKPDFEYFNSNYETAHYKLDTFSLFIEKSIRIANNKGLIGLIVPYTWLTIQQHSKLREFVLSFDLLQIINLPTKIFEDADLDTVISIIQKNRSVEDIKIGYIENKEIILKGELSVNNIKASSDYLINVNLNNQDFKIIEKIQRESKKLTDIFKVSQGYIPYRRSDLIVEYGKDLGNRIVDERLWHSNTKESDEFKQEIQGRDLSRYSYKESFQYIKYGKHLAGYVEPIFFTSPRILIMEVTRGERYVLKSCFVVKEFYNTPSIINIIHPDNNINDLKYLLALINSRLFTWYHKKVHPKANAITSIPKILVNDVRKLPFKPIDSTTKKAFVEKANLMLSINENLQNKIEKFIKRVIANLKVEKITNKLQFFYEYDFKTFISELKKQKIVISIKEQDEWEDYFDDYKKNITEEINKLNKTENEIDQMVYELYELTEVEIKLVELN